MTDKCSNERTARAKKYELRATQWINETFPKVSAAWIPHFKDGPDQGDGICWRLRGEEKYWFRTFDAKEAPKWVDEYPPENWPGIMLTADYPIHRTWLYIVINTAMTRLAWIDMEQYRVDQLSGSMETNHPTGGKQISMYMPQKCFTFKDLK